MQVLYLDSQTKESAIRQIIDKSECFDDLDRDELYKAVLKRESIGSTNLGHGVLATHGQINGLFEPRVSLGVFTKGIKVERDEMINFVLVFASDPNRYDLYVKKLSEALKLFHKPLVLSSLLDAEVPQDLQRV